MKIIERIVSQLHHTYRGPAWHGPTLVELLRGMDEQEAARVAVPNVHSIWELVLHCAAWKRAVIRRIDGDRADLQGVEDWPLVVDTSNRAWLDALADLDAAHAELEARIARLDQADLDRNAPGQQVTLFDTILGVIQHDIYHAGQVALLKKAI